MENRIPSPAIAFFPEVQCLKKEKHGLLCFTWFLKIYVGDIDTPQTLLIWKHFMIMGVESMQVSAKVSAHSKRFGGFSQSLGHTSALYWGLLQLPSGQIVF